MGGIFRFKRLSRKKVSGLAWGMIKTKGHRETSPYRNLSSPDDR